MNLMNIPQQTNFSLPSKQADFHQIFAPISGMLCGPFPGSRESRNLLAAARYTAISSGKGRMPHLTRQPRVDIAGIQASNKFQSSHPPNIKHSHILWCQICINPLHPLWFHGFCGVNIRGKGFVFHPWRSGVAV